MLKTTICLLAALTLATPVLARDRDDNRWERSRPGFQHYDHDDYDDNHDRYHYDRKSKDRYYRSGDPRYNHNLRHFWSMADRNGDGRISDREYRWYQRNYGRDFNNGYRDGWHNGWRW